MTGGDDHATAPGDPGSPFGALVPHIVTGNTGEEPFRGLWYFDEPHAHLFFGRDAQIDELLQKLQKSHFVAVLGSSASGKSSLVRAGLIPALRAGLLVTAGGRWTVIVARPGHAPIASLAERIAEQAPTMSATDVETTLKRGPLGLIDAVQQGLSTAQFQNVLVVIDQFEELFRYQDEAQGEQRLAAADEAAAYVKLLLHATSQSHVPLYVVLTMRSDFLGRCAQFADLPERFNEAIYLVPRMGRDQLQSAMEGPIAVTGGEIERALVQKVLNDLGDDPDQLPVLQHALLMTWRRTHGALALKDYQLTGALEDALSRDANRVHGSLSPAHQEIARTMFQALCSRDPDGRVVRRRAMVQEVVDVSGAAATEVVFVAQAFIDAGLLTFEDGWLDVPHESLIRKWNKFGTGTDEKGWLDDEVEARDLFLDLVKRDERRRDEKDLLDGIELERALRWGRRRRRPAWARRYVDNGEQRFRHVRAFIVDSIRESRRQDRARLTELRARSRRKTAYVVVALVAAAASIGFSWYTLELRARALANAREANEQRENAELITQNLRQANADLTAQKAATDKASAAANTAKELAESNAATARLNATAARAAQMELLNKNAQLEEQRAEAVGARDDAKAARVLAENNEADAKKALDQAKVATIKAEQAQKVAANERAAADGLKNAAVTQELAARARALQRPEEQALAAEFLANAYLRYVTNCPDGSVTPTCPAQSGSTLVSALHGTLNRTLARNWPDSLGGGGILSSRGGGSILRAARGGGTAGSSGMTVFSARPGSHTVTLAVPFYWWQITPETELRDRYVKLQALDRRVTAVAVDHARPPDVLTPPVTGSADGSLAVGQREPFLTEPKPIVALAIRTASATTSIVWAMSDGELRHLGDKGIPPPAVKTGRRVIRTLNYDTSVILAGTSDGLLLWDLRGEPVMVNGSAGLDVRSIAVAPSENMIAFGDSRGVVRVAPLRNPSEMSSQRFSDAIGGAVNALAFSPSGELLAAASADGGVRVFRLTDARAAGILNSRGGLTVPPIVFEGHTGKAESVAFVTDDTLLSGGEDGTIRAWSTRMDVLAAALCREAGLSPGRYQLRDADRSQLRTLLPDTTSPETACTRVPQAATATTARR